MANITKRVGKKGETSFLIRVFIDEKSDGTQSVKSMTYKPEAGLTPKQMEKKANEAAVLFEQKVKLGLTAYDGSIKFADYAAKWMETAQIAPKTREGYEYCLKRINTAIGHLKLQNIQAHHLEAFYKNLTENGINSRGRFALSDRLREIMTERKITQEGLAASSGVSSATVNAAFKGKRVSIGSADKISAAMDIPLKELFKVNAVTTGLSDKTVFHHHRLISAILGKAKKERIVPYNVASEHATAPKVEEKEAVYLDDSEARRLVDLLLKEEDIRVRTAILLALCSGVRRGELCGLSWDDIDEKNMSIRIVRASQYLKELGIIQKPPKNKPSKRAIDLPNFIFDVLAEYKEWWLEQECLYGDKWEGSENRLFIQADGKPLFPDTINYWLNKFIIKHGLGHFTPHNLRHTFSALQITAGVDVRTLQSRTGHSRASTLTDIYAHTIRTAQEKAAAALEDVLLHGKQ